MFHLINFSLSLGFKVVTTALQRHRTEHNYLGHYKRDIFSAVFFPHRKALANGE